MNKRKFLLLFSLLGVAGMVIAKFSVELGICYGGDYSCVTNFDKAEHISYFFPFILTATILTSIMPEVVFEKWWKFARIAIPAGFVLLIFIASQIHYSQNGSGFGFANMMQGLFDYYATIALYMIFVIGSAIQIVRGFLLKPQMQIAK